MAKRGRKTKGGKKQIRFRLDQLDISVLKAALDKKLALLAAEKRELAGRLAEIDALVASLGGLVGSGVRKVAKGVAKVTKAAKAVQAAKAGKGRRGPRAGNTLGNTMAGILGEKGPMRVLDIVEAVRASSYASKSPHLRSMINQTLRADSRFRRVRRGLYKLA